MEDQPELLWLDRLQEMVVMEETVVEHQLVSQLLAEKDKEIETMINLGLSQKRKSQKHFLSFAIQMETVQIQI